MVKPSQGEIYWVEFDGCESDEAFWTRPAVVVQNDLLNRSNMGTTVVALLSSSEELAEVPGNVLLPVGTANLPRTCVALATHLTIVENRRLLQKIGDIPQETMRDVIRGCQMVVSSSPV